MENTLDHITAQMQGDVLILEINAPALDNFGVTHLTTKEIETAVSNCADKKVILSLKNVKFITSVGLSLFARLTTLAKNTGTRLILCDATEVVAMTLRTTRMINAQSGAHDHRLVLKNDLDAALLELA